MLEIFGKEYYIDVDAIINVCLLENKKNNIFSDKNEQMLLNEDENDVLSLNTENILELNVFKYEIFKGCVERLLNELSEPDPELEIFGGQKFGISFKIAYNTLLKYNILVENNHDD